MIAADLVRRGYKIAIPYVPDPTSTAEFGRRTHTSRSSSGASRIRTGGLRRARTALYQLSYGPNHLRWYELRIERVVEAASIRGYI
jgi:hypothetical protein